MLPEQEPKPAIIVSDHATDEGLELYSLNLLRGEDLAELETHLMACEFCRQSLDQVDETISLLRQELKGPELQQRTSELKSRKEAGKILIFKRPN